MVRDLFQKHVRIRDKLDVHVRQEFEEIRNTGGDSMQIHFAVEFLAKALKVAEPRKNVVLQMDNFDAPLLTVLDITFKKYNDQKLSAIRLWNNCRNYMVQLITKINTLSILDGAVYMGLCPAFLHDYHNVIHHDMTTSLFEYFTMPTSAFKTYLEMFDAVDLLNVCKKQIGWCDGQMQFSYCHKFLREINENYENKRPITAEVINKLNETPEYFLGSSFMSKLVTHPTVAGTMWVLMKPGTTVTIANQQLSVCSDEMVVLCDLVSNKREMVPAVLECYMTLLLKSGILVRRRPKTEMLCPTVTMPNVRLTSSFEQVLQKALERTTSAEKCVSVIENFLSRYTKTKALANNDFESKINAAFDHLYAEASESKMVTVANATDKGPGEPFLCGLLNAAGSSLPYKSRGVEPWVYLVDKKTEDKKFDHFYEAKL